MTRRIDPDLTPGERVAFAMLLVEIALVFLMLHLLWGCVPSACNAPTPAPHVKTAADIAFDEYARTVKLYVACPDGDKLGSGVRIGGKTVLTAKHVVECEDLTIGAVTVTDQGGAVYFGDVVGVSPQDVARLEVDELPSLPRVKIATATLGDRACGTFAVPQRGRRCGEIWPSFAAAPGDLHVDYVSEHGNSGGPLWNENGDLLGVVVYLFLCQGTEENLQVCTAGATSLISRSWLAAP